MKQVTFTNDELRAFSEHIDYYINELEWEVEPNLQSFIDKTLCDNQNSVTKDSYFIKTKGYTIEDNSSYDKIPKRY